MLFNDLYLSCNLQIATLSTRRVVKKMDHSPRTPEEQEQLDKKMLEETKRYYARLDLKYSIAFALSIIALLINVINLLRL